MAFADPQSVTINGVAKTLNKVKSLPDRTIYQTDTEDFTLSLIQQETGNRKVPMAGRSIRTYRLDTRTVAANPLTTVNEMKTATIKLVVDEPEFGFDDTFWSQVLTGIVAHLTASSNAKFLQLLTGQT